MDKDKIKATGNRKNLLFFLINSFLVLIFVGSCITIFGPILIDVSNSYKVQIEKLGLIFSLYSLGYVSGMLFNIFTYNKLNLKFLLRVFYFIFSLAFLFIFVFKLLITLYICNFIFGICASYIQVNLIYIFSELKKDNGFIVSLATFFVAFGAFIGTIIGPFLIKSGLSFNEVFLIISIILFLNFVISFFVKFPIPELNKDEAFLKNILSFKKYGKSLNIIIFLIIAFGIFILFAIENNISAWIPTFFRTVKNYDIRLAGSTTGIFWIAMASGRLLVGYINKKFNIYKTSIFLIVLFIMAFTATVLINDKLSILFFGLSGFFITGLWPNSIIISTGFFKNKKNFSISILMISGFAGSGLFNLLIMKTVEIKGIGFAIFLFCFLSLVLLIIFILAFLMNKFGLRKKIQTIVKT